MQVNEPFRDVCRKVLHLLGKSPGSFFLFRPGAAQGLKCMRVYINPLTWTSAFDAKTFNEALSWIDHESKNKEIGVAISYEALHQFESVPAAKHDSYKIPLILGVSHEVIFEIEDLTESISIRVICGDPSSVRGQIVNALKIELPMISKHISLGIQEQATIISEHSDVSKTEYMQRVQEIQELIREGEVYQVNLSHKITLPFGNDGASLFSAILEGEPPLYGGLINDPFGEWSIVSASPEGFLIGSEDGLLAAMPIKGTRRSGETAEETSKLAEDLLSSSKDHAELSMIVDLIRNDLGRVCEFGSIEVLNHARLEHHGTVIHLVSDVRGMRRKGEGVSEILRALFPSGSVTGAPKIAAMKQISRIEGTARGPYTGSFGTVGPNGQITLSVGIRTGLVRNGVFQFQVGGGIVIDSSPEEEYMETIYKARVMLEAWERAGSS